MVTEAQPNERTWQLLTRAIEKCARRKLFFSVFYELGRWSAMAGPASLEDDPATLILVEGPSLGITLENFLLSLVKLERENGWRS